MEVEEIDAESFKMYGGWSRLCPSIYPCGEDSLILVERIQWGDSKLSDGTIPQKQLDSRPCGGLVLPQLLAETVIAPFLWKIIRKRSPAGMELLSTNSFGSKIVDAVSA